MRILQLAIIFGMAWIPPCGAAAAQARIEVELVSEPGVPPTAPQRWLSVLKEVDNLGLSIRSARGGERESVENRGTDSAPRYHVMGVLTQGNRLKLPGAEFSLSDRGLIRKWFDRLRTEGDAAVTGKTVAFGLTAQQVVEFHKQLTHALSVETHQRRAGDVAKQIVEQLPLKFHVTSDASRAFKRNEPVLDELKGLSRGTALAALLRPLGLVAAPRRGTSGNVELLIADVREIEESWPIGWPPQASPYRVAPTLFEKLDVEIHDTPLSDALAALQKRVDLPFLLDHNSMLRHRIDPAEIKVSFPKSRASHRKIVERVLFQGRLKSELRVDDGDRPFLWITTSIR